MHALLANSINASSIIQITSSGQTTSTASLPTGVNLSSLSSLSRGGQNLRLHNLVSLANNVQGTNQCIALPISLMMAPNTISTNSTPNSTQQQLNSNGNLVVGLEKELPHHHQTTNQPTQNVVLINNLDHTTNQSIAYQSQTSQFQIGSTLGSLGNLNNCRLATNQTLLHTGIQANNLASNIPNLANFTSSYKFEAINK